jgi:hypothetical protein
MNLTKVHCGFVDADFACAMEECPTGCEWKRTIEFYDTEWIPENIDEMDEYISYLMEHNVDYVVHGKNSYKVTILHDKMSPESLKNLILEKKKEINRKLKDIEFERRMRDTTEEWELPF